MEVSEVKGEEEKEEGLVKCKLGRRNVMVDGGE